MQNDISKVLNLSQYKLNNRKPRVLNNRVNFGITKPIKLIEVKLKLNAIYYI